MKRDSRLSVALHVLLHMEELGEVMTSTTIGTMMETNPVVVRRTMAGLREAGIVSSEKGHGGGWSLARSLDTVTLGEVYEALGTPPLFSIGPRDDNPGCVVEQAVNRAIGKALDEARELLMAQLRSVRVSDLAADFRRKGAGSATPRKQKGLSHA
jgi:DNA-binding IscR family transcriptional regulator